MTTTIERQEPYSAERIAEIMSEYNRDGYYLIRNVLTSDEVTALKAGIDNVFENPAFDSSMNRYGNMVAVRLFETNPIFEQMLVREPIIGLMEAILGPDCHLVAQNAVRNAPGQAIDQFHADDLVMFPLPEGIERHDPRVTMPVFMLTVQIPLTDIPSDEYGPTQFVPGSHYSGRSPNDMYNPSFEGRGPVSIHAKAGDIYLHNGQCWHRGAPNTSDRTRYLLQLAFSQRWVSQRFYPFVNYKLPEHIMAGTDERLKRVLGIHPTGAYG